MPTAPCTCLKCLDSHHHRQRACRYGSTALNRCVRVQASKMCLAAGVHEAVPFGGKQTWSAQRRDSDTSAITAQGSAQWDATQPKSYAPKIERFSTPVDLLPAGMLSPDCAFAAFAPDGIPAAPKQQQQQQQRQALGNLPVPDSIGDSPRLACHLQRSSQQLDSDAAVTAGTCMRRDSHASDLSHISNFEHSAHGDNASSAVQCCAHAAQPAKSTSSGSSQDAASSFTWLAHPEVQATIIEMLDEEVATAINPEYMDSHSEAVMPDGLWVTPAMRLMTVNWMSEAVEDLDLDQVCAGLTVACRLA